jgi:hypothetical protein
LQRQVPILEVPIVPYGDVLDLELGVEPGQRENQLSVCPVINAPVIHLDIVLLENTEQAQRLEVDADPLVGWNQQPVRCASLPD